MNKYQKLVYRTVKYFWIAIRKNSNDTRTWKQFYRSFRRVLRYETMEELRSENEWVKRQY